MAAAENPSPPPEPWGWTRPQRIALASLLFLFLILLVIGYLRRPYRLDDPIVVVNGQPVTLSARTDPNTATLQELARIPHLGDKLASKIIDYRDARISAAPDHIVFHSADDLSHVVGPKTLAQLRPYFQFPDDPVGDGATTMDAPEQ